MEEAGGAAPEVAVEGDDEQGGVFFVAGVCSVPPKVLLDTPCPGPAEPDAETYVSAGMA